MWFNNMGDFVVGSRLSKAEVFPMSLIAIVVVICIVFRIGEVMQMALVSHIVQKIFLQM